MMPDLFNSSELAVFTTREFARLADISVAAASKRLRRLSEKSRSLVSLTRGAWANTMHPAFSPMACVPVLIGNEQGYVSFLSALHVHGALSQIPGTIQVATTGHTRKLRTTVGVFDFLQMKPDMFRSGIEWSETTRPFRIAVLEKALLDTLYVSTRKSRRFARLPELSLRDAGFDVRRYRSLLKSHTLPRPISAAMNVRFRAAMTRETGR